MAHHRIAWVVGLACALALAGCTRGAPDTTTLEVFAASSLAEAFGDLERGFERAHDRVDVRVTYAGSQVLRLQIEQGAGADVFASADEVHMGALAEAGHVAGARVFARNELVVIVPRENPARITSFDELPRAKRLVIGTEQVPAGRYARALIERAGRRLGDAFARDVYARVVSQESNVRLARAKVELGEADAALVYRTDARASDLVETIEVPADLGARASYPIAALTRSARPELARAFVEYVMSERAREVLARRGFVTEAP